MKGDLFGHNFLRVALLPRYFGFDPQAFIG